MQLSENSNGNSHNSRVSRLTIWEPITHWWLEATRWLAILGGFLLLALMLFVTADVTARYLRDQPLPGNVELSQTLLVMVVGLSFAYTQATDSNLRLDIIRERISQTGQTAIDIISLLLGLILISYTTWLAGQLMVAAWQTNEVMQGIWGVPYFPSRLALTVGMFLLWFQLFIDLIHRVLQALKFIN